jgi:enterochelin esterase-like enzyme
LLFLPALLFAQSGTVFDNLSLPSKILKSDRKYAVYLPPGYETSTESYPVLYLLHGSGGSQKDWIQLGNLFYIANTAINNGPAIPMIIIMPDAGTDRRTYFNTISGDWNYEDFFFKELIPYVEKSYRVKSEKRYRAVAGLSAGGGASFIYALHHPEMFSSSCPISANVGIFTLDVARQNYNKNYPGIADTTIVHYYRQHNVIGLVNDMPNEQKGAVRWYIDEGDDDPLYEGNCLVHIAMRKKEIPHEFRIRDGDHNWAYWREALPAVLQFVSQGFTGLVR